jgi:hypothetical protein
LTTPHEELNIIPTIEQMAKNYHPKECVSDYYNHNEAHFNEILHYANGEVKVEDSLYDNGAYHWNFEDYFTI